MTITFQTSTKSAEKIKLKKKEISNILMSDMCKSNDHKEFLMGSSDSVIPALFFNGFIGTIVQAYNRHYNLVLRPDDFWAAVMTQFSFYLNKYSNKFRTELVDFDDTKVLTVYGLGTVSTAKYDVLTELMTEQISQNIKDPSIKDWVIPNFSTTTNTDKTVFSVILLSSMKSYFEFRFGLECGIPNVTLLGTPEDYENLANRVARLLEFDCEDRLMTKWYKYLSPIFTELVNASKGNPNTEFWSRICSKYSDGSGPSYLSGWITSFLCFDSNGEWKGDDKTIKFYEEEDYSENFKYSEYPVIDENNILQGLVSVPVVVFDNYGSEYNTTMFSGTIASDVVNETTLSPRLDWSICLKK